jgi:hypothetical protein
MPGIAHSIAKKKQMARAEQEKAYAEVMKEYRDEQKKPESERKSRKAICRDVAEKWKAMKKPVTVGDDKHGVNEDEDIDGNDSDDWSSEV